MAYSEKLAERIRKQLKGKRGISERKMFGGICFCVNNNMAVGVAKDTLMVRFGKENHDKYIKMKHAEPMDFTGKPMKGFAFVAEQNLKSSAALKKWIDIGIGHAKSLPKK